MVEDGCDLELDEAILAVAGGGPDHHQAVLQRLLAAEGHAPSQSTLSRHLKRLSIQKVGGRYQRVEPGVARAHAGDRRDLRRRRACWC